MIKKILRKIKDFVREKIFPITAWLPRYDIVFRWGIFDKNDLVLDIGCGEGIMALKLAFRCRHVIGLDINEGQIHLAQRRKKSAGRGVNNTSFLTGDILCLPFPEETFDKIIFLDALPEIREDAGALRELARVLKKGGRLIITAATDYTCRAHLFSMQRVLRRIVPRYFWREYASTGRSWFELSDAEVRRKLRIYQNYTLEDIRRKAEPFLEVTRHTHILRKFAALATDITYGLKGFWPFRFLFFWPAVRLDYYFGRHQSGYTVVVEFKKKKDAGA